MGKALVLTGISGERVGSSITFSARTNIVGSGRNAMLSLHEGGIAPQYAELRQVLDRWFVAPQAPNARVFVNGTLVSTQARIKEGDLVTFGSSTFRAAFSNVEELGASQSTHNSGGGVPRLGEYLMRKGFITQAQLDEAIRNQNNMRRQGRRVQIGDILYTMGLISRAQLEIALQDQRGDYYEQFRD